MTYLKFSREEWEQLTGSDESENFVYRVFDEDQGFVEHEVEGDDAQIRVFLDEEETSMEVSSHAFVPSLEFGNGIYENPDGWGELNQWTIDGDWYTAIISALKAQA